MISAKQAKEQSIENKAANAEKDLEESARWYDKAKSQYRSMRWD